MAIPFALPSDEEAEDQSQQQLEQLMLDLYAALQQVLRARNAQHPPRNRKYRLFDLFDPARASLEIGARVLAALGIVSERSASWRRGRCDSGIRE